ncbi:ricin B lectin (PTP6d) [Vairimorpha necatrix]|uniref:Ricin B lectin (PTP6d) n=1 Tax=Vairimorpha necatrix TaxID=6039 RepID=A0AAX4J858_9MICR
MILLFLCSTLQFYIKHLNEDRFMKGSLSNGDVTSVMKSDLGPNDDFSVINSWGDGVQGMRSSNGQAVWDIGNAWTLTYNRDAHRKDNQRFYLSLIAPKTFVIKNRGKCIEYDKNDDKYYSKACTLQDNQKFQVLKDKDELDPKPKFTDKSKIGTSEKRKILILHDDDGHHHHRENEHEHEHFGNRHHSHLRRRRFEHH